MSNAPEEFEQLRKLLKLKRHEQPPPGYFNTFSTRVLDRIENETADPAWRLWQEAPWLKRLLNFLELNPMAAGAFAAGVCALLLGGIVYSEYGGDAQLAAMPADRQPAPAPMAMALDRPKASFASSTNAIMGSLSGLSAFDNALGKLQAQQVSLNLGSSR